jgi:hypothetical protein
MSPFATADWVFAFEGEFEERVKGIFPKVEGKKRKQIRTGPAD